MIANSVNGKLCVFYTYIYNYLYFFHLLDRNSFIMASCVLLVGVTFTATRSHVGQLLRNRRRQAAPEFYLNIWGSRVCLRSDPQIVIIIMTESLLSHQNLPYITQQGLHPLKAEQPGKCIN